MTVAQMYQPEDDDYNADALRRLTLNKGSAPRRKPEREIVKEGIQYLRSIGGYAWKIHGGAMGNVGEPDVDACVRGRSIKLEAKAMGNKPTGPQIAALRRWSRAGALVGWFRSNEHIMALLDHLGEPGYVPDLAHPGCVCERHAGSRQ
jgi:hypothetical protein